jgi:hypothetical protein
MTQEWRATGGASGLPVVNLGNALRTPRHALEKLLGIDLADVTVGLDGDGLPGGHAEAGAGGLYRTSVGESEPATSEALGQRPPRHRRKPRRR